MRYPVLRLSFGGNYTQPGYLQEDLNDQLESLEQRMGVPPHPASGPRLRELFADNDFAGIETLLRSHFDAIPYEWHTRNDIAGYEGYYASVLYSCFAALGFDVVAEDGGARGRCDMTLRFNSHVYIFELKVVELAGAGSALAQLRERGYAGKYRGRGEPIHLIGVEFSRATRTVSAFQVADG